MTAVFRTRPESAAVHPSGWAPLRSGVEVTRVPLVDSTTPEPLLARLTYRDAQDAARRLGGRLPTREEVVALISEGYVVEPVTLSWGPEMVTREHAAKHDRIMWQRLATWDGQRPVMGAGKHWIAGATGENVRICGWWDGRRLIQAGIALDNPHHLGAARSHVDYATTTLVVREARTRPEEPPPVLDTADTDPAPPLSWDDHLDGTERLGLRCLAWLGWQVGLDPRELPGARHDPRILAYSRECRRGGTFLGVDATGRPLWSGGAPLPLGRDEDAWCAAAASATLLGAMRPGDAPPHGLRVSVRELVEDARGTGAWRGLDYVPRPGDLGIDARAGGDPTRGGTGHVWRVVQVEDGMALGAGGNEGDRWTVSWRALRAPERRGWIAYP